MGPTERNGENTPVTAVLIGAGARGRGAYGKWGLNHPDRIRFIAVAEPSGERLKAFADEHNIDPRNRFSDWRDLLAEEKLADVCLICTQDQMHTEPALAALNAGYDVLLEKPMAVNEEDCLRLVETSEKQQRQLRICHVARYAGFFQTLKQAIHDGLIGTPIHVNHSENVASWHFAHGFVRGNWRKSAESSPVILAKTCHDLDLLYWLLDSPAESVHSFGTLSFFHSGNAPKGAPRRCTDGCPKEKTCPWYAPRLYVTAESLIRITTLAESRLVNALGSLALNAPNLLKLFSVFYPPFKTLVHWDQWPATVVTENCTVEEKWQAMHSGPYGRCVFYCDNDVPDHQTVNIQFRSGATATMTMQGHSYLDGRWVRIDGSLGTLMGHFTHAGEELLHFDHRSLKKTRLWKAGISLKPHGGGDDLLMESFVRSLRAENQADDALNTMTSARDSLESHLMAFAAELSRLEKRVVELAELR